MMGAGMVWKNGKNMEPPEVLGDHLDRSYGSRNRILRRALGCRYHSVSDCRDIAEFLGRNFHAAVPEAAALAGVICEIHPETSATLIISMALRRGSERVAVHLQFCRTGPGLCSCVQL